MSSISIAIIHNRDPRRLAHILPASRALADRVGANLFEVYEQPAIRPHSAAYVLYKQTLMWKINREWECYREIVPSPFVTSAIRHVVRAPGRLTGRARRVSAIEAILASKHISTWETAIANGSDYLVVLEDDAIVQANTADRFRALFELLGNRDASRLLYVDLAGGFNIDELAVARLIDYERDGFLHFRRPATNTACGYLINRATVQRFCTILASRPWFRHAPLDWLINCLMMRAIAEGSEFDCWHANPSMFQHGSLLRLYESALQ
jgi:hypothetical protein